METIFLLGAGASVDAGMPTIAGLTKTLRERLPQLRDANGTTRPEFGDVFDYIEAHDPLVGQNYERFFEWIDLLIEARKEPFRRAIEIRMPAELFEAMFHLRYVVGEEVARLLESYQTEQSYLARLRDFIPNVGRLKVFSLNYDCCLEDACSTAGINVETGFDPGTKRWNPSLFQTTIQGINLYKLHGSLRRFLAADSDLLEKGILENQSHFYLQLKPEERVSLPSNLDVSSKPELVLGPGIKVQVDDPFLTLFYEFHRSIPVARVCVIIGYGYGDSHINKKLDEALELGARLFDVNSGNPCTSYLAIDRYRHLKLSAQTALTNGHLQSELQKLQ